MLHDAGVLCVIRAGLQESGERGEGAALSVRWQLQRARDLGLCGAGLLKLGPAFWLWDDSTPDLFVHFRLRSFWNYLSSI